MDLGDERLLLLECQRVLSSITKLIKKNEKLGLQYEKHETDDDER